MSIMEMLGGGPPEDEAPLMGGPPPGGPGLGPPPPGPMGGPPPGLEDGGGQPGEPDSPESEAALQDAIDALRAFLDTEEDDQDKAVAAKCLANLQSIFGGRQKEEESAQGITPAHKAMGRAMSKRRAPAGAAGAY